MAEYYELILRHRTLSGDGHDPYLEQPIIVKGFISPLMQKSVCDERGDLIDEMYHKIKEYWKGGDHHER